LEKLKIPATLDIECDPFRLVAQCLNKLRYGSAPPGVSVDVKTKRLDLLGNMRIMDETKVAERNCELEQEVESWLSRGM
jgi:hypothetical protein